MKKPKPILTETELKLLKSMIFILIALSYGLLIKFSSGWLVTILFGILLWIYLREIYGGKDEFR